jgi:protein kinase C substrate 80K-H
MDVDGSEDTAKEEEVEDVEDAYEVPDDAEDDETEEERAMRIASQWIPDVGKEDQGDDYELDEDQNDGKAMQDSLDTMEESLSLGLLDTIRLWIGDQIAYLTGKAGVSGELKTATARLKALEKKAIAARDEFRKKDNALREVEREMVDLKRKLGQKYGEGDAFLLISESCVEARSTDGKHTYKVCPFGKAEQLEGRRSTGVGRWEGFAKIGEEIAMVFTNGDSCWQGPRRSFTAILRCGPQDLLEAVSEPSKCEYSGVLKTPAFCSNDMLEMLRKEIRRRELLIDSAVVGKDQVHQEL